MRLHHAPRHARPQPEDPAPGPTDDRRGWARQHWHVLLGLAVVLLVAGAAVLTGLPREPAPGQAEASQLHLTWPRDPRWTVGVHWQTASSTSNRVLIEGPDGRWRTRHGRTPAEPPGTSGVLHEIEVTSLEPDTEYRYAVATDSGMSRPYSFRTAPRPPGSFTFAAFGEQGDCETYRPACKVIKQITEEQPAFVLGVGDLTHAGANGVPAEDRWLQAISSYASRAPLMPAPAGRVEPAGGLDAPDALPASHLTARFGIPGLTDPGYYSFDYGGVHVVALPDSSAQDQGGTDAAMLSWLEADLEAARADDATRWIVAFTNRPIYSTGQTHGAYAPFQQELVPLFDRYRVDVVISGEQHHYERTLPMRDGVPTLKTLGVVPSGTGTVYVVSGGGGVPLDDDFGERAPWVAVRSAVHHHLLFEVTPRLLQMRVVTTSRHVVDQLVVDHRN